MLSSFQANGNARGAFARREPPSGKPIWAFIWAGSSGFRVA